MTPKEQAKDLVNTFYYSLPNNGSTEGINSTTRRYQEAIKCALITIDRILREENNLIQTIRQFDYWHEVIQEIKKI
tara:strand:- start:1964 stop:2191 length:228 start_codon:yes stop_codon:yes gene_type:complete